MNSIKTLAPILITSTRSFWLCIVPAGLTLIDIIAGAVSDCTAEPIAAIFGPVFGVTAAEAHAFMLAVAPLCALIVAHQQSGLAAPIPRALRKSAIWSEPSRTARALLKRAKLSVSTCCRADPDHLPPLRPARLSRPGSFSRIQAPGRDPSAGPVQSLRTGWSAGSDCRQGRASTLDGRRGPPKIQR